MRCVGGVEESVLSRLVDWTLTDLKRVERRAKSIGRSGVATRALQATERGGRDETRDQRPEARRARRGGGWCWCLVPWCPGALVT